ncbi:hypothetical protein CEUSTIGMA_g8903.t1 [Chlamydomonas eustigma]|uniref:Uncharacterized protein n=1 Tax=Chlamydomonas eustigma TaxID=1157962 RepID=A0A250XEG1_9CHLO|nr:hypothetical protein CEUSTIGMA_g8903.t1 [Chlamydomonas eustigma]|eukprot:GAX81474.1 hypothetical protein CEUSTIGMA_g8903.t1 [Chlamydomonas eustigma]
MPSPSRLHGGISHLSAPSDVDAIKKQYQMLRVKYDKTEEKLSEFREKLRDVRAELVTKDRQLEVAKRMVQRVQSDKNDVESAHELDRAHVRKLEAKLNQSTDLADLHTKYLRMRTKCSDLSNQLQEMESRAYINEETNMQLTQEVNLLKTALGLKHEMGGAVGNNQAVLLRQLSKSQAESTALAMQLSESQNELHEVLDKLDMAKEEVLNLKQAKASLEDKLEQTLQEMTEAIDTASMFRKEAEHAKSEATKLQNSLDEMRSNLLRSEQHLRSEEQQSSLHQEKSNQLTDRLQSVERASRLSLEALRTEVTLAVERAESRAVEQRAGWTVREAALQDECSRLRNLVEDSQKALHDERQQWKSESGRLQKDSKELQESLAGSRASERNLTLEVERLHGQVDYATDLNRTLQMKLNSAEDQAATTQRQVEDVRASFVDQQRLNRDMHQQIESLMKQLEALEVKRKERETDLQLQIKELLAQQSTTTKANDLLHGQCEALRLQVSDAEVNAVTQDGYAKQLLETIEDLNDSKRTLQSFMAEQIKEFKLKLLEAEDENKQLRIFYTSSRVGSPAASTFLRKSVSPKPRILSGSNLSSRAMNSIYEQNEVESDEEVGKRAYTTRTSSAFNIRSAQESKRSELSPSLYRRAKNVTKHEVDSDDEEFRSIIGRRLR